MTSNWQQYILQTAAVHFQMKSKRNLVQANKEYITASLDCKQTVSPGIAGANIRQVNHMKAFDYLNQIKKIDMKINNDMEELEKLQTLATKTTSALGGNKVQASSSQQKMADCVHKIVQLKKDIDSEIDKYVDYKEQVKNLIHEACDADCCRLLYLRYFKYETWEAIAEEMNYSREWIARKLHKKALGQVQTKLDEKK